MISNSSIKNLKFFKNSTNRKISEKQTTSVFATNEHNVESVMSRQGWPPDTIKNIIYPFNRTDFALFCHYCKVGLGGFYACNIQEKLQLEKFPFKKFQLNCTSKNTNSKTCNSNNSNSKN